VKSIKRWFRSYRYVLLLAAAFYLISLFEGNMAALVIVGVVWLLVLTLWATAAIDATTSFDPYYLRIWVKPYEILVDLGLSAPMDNATWATVKEQDPQLTAKLEQKFFEYTVLGPKLVHCSTPGQFAFFEVLNLHHALTKVEWTDKLSPGEWKDDLKFFFKLAPGRKHYEFGVAVPKRWWAEQKLKDGVSPDLKKLDARANGDLIFGTIPIAIPFDEENGFEHRYLEITGCYLEQLNEPFHATSYEVGYIAPTRRIGT
jgi:hypothetical protein